ncbi:MAG: hypothetical protein U1F81_08320 [Verrucomicrobiaceae bacterium]
MTDTKTMAEKMRQARMNQPHQTSEQARAQIARHKTEIVSRGYPSNLSIYGAVCRKLGLHPLPFREHTPEALKLLQQHGFSPDDPFSHPSPESLYDS